MLYNTILHNSLNRKSNFTKTLNVRVINFEYFFTYSCISLYITIFVCGSLFLYNMPSYTYITRDMVDGVMFCMVLSFSLILSQYGNCGNNFPERNIGIENDILKCIYWWTARRFFSLYLMMLYRLGYKFWSNLSVNYCCVSMWIQNEV